jgi:adenosylcobinamide kinase/adenosylcobinamide-phosphate guanylyltransferase
MGCLELTGREAENNQMNAQERHLVVGGARSGKTRHALELAELASRQRGAPVIYVATAESGDDEMAERIARHRAERPQAWNTLEAPRSLGGALQSVAPDAVIVVDCLTLWLSNALLQDFDADRPRAALATWAAECAALLEFLAGFPGVTIMVSNEVGCGIVPMSALARRFQDEQGRLNQVVAALCERVTWVVAGIPVAIKPRAAA